MRKTVTMPRMGQSMDEGRVLRWLKEIGAEVKRGEVLAEIETDKAIVEIEALEGGTLVEILVPAGEVVPVGTTIAFLDDGQAMPDGLHGREPALSTSSLPAIAEPLIQPTSEEEKRPTRQGERANASPVARRLAEEHGVDLTQVQGSGPGGRIGKEDVEAWLEARRKDTPAPMTEDVVRVPLSRIKQATARRMSESKASAPHFYVSMDIEVSQIMALRDWLKGRGDEVSINHLVLKATALALAHFPNLNATFAGDDLHIHSHVNLAIAAAINGGLITPVIHHCEKLSLTEMASAARQVIFRARAGHLRPEDLEGGTFTVSNLGMFGVKQFEAIINPPQVAILTVGGVRRVPIFDAHDHIVPGQLLTATVSADHRVTDGAEVARFLQELKSTLGAGFALM